MKESHVYIRLDGLFIIQTVLAILKLIGVPYFAEASWTVIFLPTIIVGSIVVFFLIIVALVYWE